ncbi:MAG: DUF488 domain-containing protein [Bacteroidota bacterium]
MFYRRKMILALLEVFGGKLMKINLQKVLFLITQRQTKPAYDFIPFKFGCFSFSANADLTAMVKHGFLTEDEQSFTKKDKQTYLSTLNDADRKLVNQVYTLFRNHDADALMTYTYTQYPYYAINSVKAPQLLNRNQMDKVETARPSSNKTILYTIGYEGISLEAYLNKLVRNDVKVLVDVRNNPLSQKYGFSKSLLSSCCNKLGIEYVHFAEVGIQSEDRKELNEQADYDNLFDSYRSNTLPRTTDTQQKILSLLQQKQRIALTCFEANICQCHRKHLSEAITRLPGWHYELKHI